MWRGQHGKASCLGDKTPETDTVQIFNCAFLPGAIRVGKVDLAMQPFFHTAPVGELRTPVAGNGLDQLRGKADRAATIAVSIVSAFRPGIFTAM